MDFTECILEPNIIRWKREMSNILKKYDNVRQIKSTKKIIFHENDTIHNVEFPAIITFIENGKIHYLEYLRYGKLHREGGPAHIHYYYNTYIVFRIMYFINGELHRDNGPAYIEYDMNGNIIDKEYFINGNHIN